jgi:hypothetical protein
LEPRGKRRKTSDLSEQAIDNRKIGHGRGRTPTMNFNDIVIYFIKLC